MFYGCTALRSLDISNFTSKKVVDMKNMFYNCFLLDDLNISNFKAKNINDISDMFTGCSNDLINKIKIKDKNFINSIYKSKKSCIII